MKRDYLIKLLNNYAPTEEEVLAKKSILTFVSSFENCFERELDVGHVTGSAWLLNKEGDKALLLHHRKLNRWFQPGGHADGDSNILAVALKEAKEESGIKMIEPIFENIFDLDVHQIPSNLKEKEHFHYDIRFLLQVKSDEDLHINDEAKELRWISKNRNELMTDDT